MHERREDQDAPRDRGDQRVRLALPWRQITLFLLTLGVLILCTFILQPFFSAIVGAIVLAVVTEIPYNWLSTHIRHRTTCAVVGLILVILAVIVPGFFLAQELGHFSAVLHVAFYTECYSLDALQQQKSAQGR